MKNKVDLAMGVAVGSSAQVLFVFLLIHLLSVYCCRLQLLSA